ncbi:MAG: hypothetical protein R6U46_09950 [Marinilabilia sp.]
MKRQELVYCRKKLMDRDFLYGIFAGYGFVKDPDEFFKAPGEWLPPERDVEEDFCVGGVEDDQ